MWRILFQKNKKKGKKKYFVGISVSCIKWKKIKIFWQKVFPKKIVTRSTKKHFLWEFTWNEKDGLRKCQVNWWSTRNSSWETKSRKFCPKQIICTMIFNFRFINNNHLFLIFDLVILRTSNSIVNRAKRREKENWKILPQKRRKKMF